MDANIPKTTVGPVLSGATVTGVTSTSTTPATPAPTVAPVNPLNASNNGGAPALVATVTGGGDGILAASDTGNAVAGISTSGNGISGLATTTGNAISGRASSGYGVYGYSGDNDGVHGESVSPTKAAVSGTNSSGGPGVWGQSSGSGNAGQFEGNVLVTGKLSVSGDTALTGNTTGANITLSGNLNAKDVVLSGADCAEEFDVMPGQGIEPGSVVVFGEGGELSTSAEPYNKRVAGVILDRRASSEGRAPVALVGKVFCKVDATYAPIEIGDPLTTSPTAGYAMKVSDPALAFGTVIGKALASHKDGHGLIPILVSLQ
jgi:hypothetical protein